MNYLIHKDYYTADDNGNYPIHVIAGLGACYTSGTIADMRKMIKDAPDFDLSTKTIKQGSTALHLVSRCGKPAITQLLIDNGVEINSEDLKGRTPMYEAIRGSTKSIDLLYKAKAKLDIVDNEGYTPLGFACVIGKVEAIKLLCKKRIKAKLENQSKTGLILDFMQTTNSIFHTNLLSVIRSLLNKGITVNRMDKKTNNNEVSTLAAMIADIDITMVGRRNTELLPALKPLIRAGSNPWHKNNENKSALDYLEAEEISSLGSSIKSFLKGNEKEIVELIKTKNDILGFYRNQNHYKLTELRNYFNNNPPVIQALNAIN